MVTSTKYRTMFQLTMRTSGLIELLTDYESKVIYMYMIH